MGGVAGGAAMNDESPLLVYVEDEENDVVLLHRALGKAGVAARLVVIDNGAEAIAYLERETKAPLSLLLLDLNLPRRSGLEVLAWIRAQPRWRELRVVIFTSSNDPGDRARADALGIADYIVKPTSIAAYLDVARRLKEYLCLPGGGRGAPAG